MVDHTWIIGSGLGESKCLTCWLICYPICLYQFLIFYQFHQNLEVKDLCAIRNIDLGFGSHISFVVGTSLAFTPVSHSITFIYIFLSFSNLMLINLKTVISHYYWVQQELFCKHQEQIITLHIFPYISPCLTLQESEILSQNVDSNIAFDF